MRQSQVHSALHRLQDPLLDLQDVLRVLDDTSALQLQVTSNPHQLHGLGISRAFEIVQLLGSLEPVVGVILELEEPVVAWCLGVAEWVVAVGVQWKDTQ